MGRPIDPSMDSSIDPSNASITHTYVQSRISQINSQHDISGLSMRELVRLVLASYCPSSSTQRCLHTGSSHQVSKSSIWLSSQFLTENWRCEQLCIRHTLERLESEVTKKEGEVVDQLVRIERMEARQKMLKQDIWRIRNDQNRKRTEKTQTWPF